MATRGRAGLLLAYGQKYLRDGCGQGGVSASWASLTCVPPRHGLRQEADEVEPVRVGISDIANEYPNGKKGCVLAECRKRGRKQVK